MKPPKAKCVHGCPNEREPWRVCCPEHWAKIPRHLKVEFWQAMKAADVGRGRRKNGTSTPRLKAALQALVNWLVENVSKPFESVEHPQP